MTKIYEIRDVTDDEVYYAIGHFLDKEEAEKQLKNINPDSDSDAYHEDIAEFELVEIEIGMHGSRCKQVGKALCTKRYDEGNDEYIWRLEFGAE